MYGSLRSGGPGAMTTRFPASRFITNAKVTGELYDFGKYPGLIVSDSGAPVVGEIYEVGTELLLRLDEFEASSNYLRKQVEIQIDSVTRTCWTYEPDPRFYSLINRIMSGDWVEYVRSKPQDG